MHDNSARENKGQGWTRTWGHTRGLLEDDWYEKLTALLTLQWNIVHKETENAQQVYCPCAGGRLIAFQLCFVLPCYYSKGLCLLTHRL